MALPWRDLHHWGGRCNYHVNGYHEAAMALPWQRLIRHRGYLGIGLDIKSVQTYLGIGLDIKSVQTAWELSHQSLLETFLQ